MDRSDPGRPGEISLAAAGAIGARLEAKVVCLHDVAARLVDGRIDLERLRAFDDDGARGELTQVNEVGRFTPEGAFTNTMAEPALAALAHEQWEGGNPARRRAVKLTR
jgi:hypothetical protein